MLSINAWRKRPGPADCCEVLWTSWFKAKRACSETWGHTGTLLCAKLTHQRQVEFRRHNPTLNQDLRIWPEPEHTHTGKLKQAVKLLFPMILHRFLSSFQQEKFLYLPTSTPLLIVPSTPWETVCHKHPTIKQSLKIIPFSENSQMRIIMIKALLWR